MELDKIESLKIDYTANKGVVTGILNTVAIISPATMEEFKEFDQFNENSSEFSIALTMTGVKKVSSSFLNGIMEVELTCGDIDISSLNKKAATKQANKKIDELTTENEALTAELNTLRENVNAVTEMQSALDKLQAENTELQNKLNSMAEDNTVVESTDPVIESNKTEAESEAEEEKNSSPKVTVSKPKGNSK